MATTTAAPGRRHGQAVRWLLQNADAAATAAAIQTLIRSGRPSVPHIALDPRAATAGLCAAASKGMRDLAEFFVGCGADANANGSDVVAADEEEEEEEEEGEEGGEEAAELADITRGLESAVPLILACSGGHLSVVELLVERGGASVETRDESGRSALHCAASTGRVDVIEYLVMKGADVHATTTAGTSITPLFAACRGGHVDAARALVKHGAKVANLDGQRDPVVAAATSGSFETVQFVVENGSRLATLERGGGGAAAATVAEDVGKEAIACAARIGQLDVVRWLHSYAEHAKKRVRVSQRVCPLHVACYMGHVGVVEVLLDERWETSGFDELLDVAVSSGHVEVVELLLHRKACRSATDRKRKKWFRGAGTEAEALVNAARQGHVEMARVLLDYGAAVDSADDLRRTALHHACEWGHVGVVELLLEEGASLEAVSIENMTAMDYAIAEGHADVVEVLRNWQ